MVENRFRWHDSTDGRAPDPNSVSDRNRGMRENTVVKTDMSGFGRKAGKTLAERDPPNSADNVIPLQLSQGAESMTECTDIMGSGRGGTGAGDHGRTSKH